MDEKCLGLLMLEILKYPKFRIYLLKKMLNVTFTIENSNLTFFSFAKLRTRNDY